MPALVFNRHQRWDLHNQTSSRALNRRSEREKTKCNSPSAVQLFSAWTNQNTDLTSCTPSDHIENFSLCASAVQFDCVFLENYEFLYSKLPKEMNFVENLINAALPFAKQSGINKLILYSWSSKRNFVLIVITDKISMLSGTISVKLIFRHPQNPTLVYFSFAIASHSFVLFHFLGCGQNSIKVPKNILHVNQIEQETSAS